MRPLCLAFCVAALGGTVTPVAAAVVEADLCIYGGTSAGVIAAVQASRMGKRAVIAEPGRHLGGLSAGGLGYTDIGNKGAIGGLSRAFYQRLGRHYGRPEAWVFEPSVAEREFNTLVQEARVRIFFGEELARVEKQGARLTRLNMQSGNIFQARMFVDATYEGDLMAQAGVPYHVGREANSVYGESLNGIRGETPKHQFLVPVDPFVKPGDPSSGLLPLIQDVPFGMPGEGDASVQAYNFRLCLTTNPENRKPIEPPRGYDPARFELLGRYFDALAAAGKTLGLRHLLSMDMVTRDKTDINNNGAVSTDYIGMNHRYPEATPAERRRIQQEHLDYTKGLLTYLATSPRVPPAVREEMSRWGLCRDEFVDHGGWPHQMYVREARRMIGAYVMTELNCRGQRVAPNPIGLAAYSMDSHNCRRLVRNGRVENEGDVQVPPISPYPIGYGAIVPQQIHCENLLVPVCLSASHIAYGSIRMEPVFMILGQSAATAACLAIDEGVSLQGLDYRRLRERLLADNQILEWTQGPTRSQGNPSPSEAQGTPSSPR